MCIVILVLTCYISTQQFVNETWEKISPGLEKISCSEMQDVPELHVNVCSNSAEAFLNCLLWILVMNYHGNHQSALAYLENVYFLISYSVELFCANSSVAIDILSARAFTDLKIA